MAMTFDFSGQTVVVTGGTRGIGRATVEAFVNAGASAYALYGGDERAAGVMRGAHAGDRVVVERLDIGDGEAVKSFWRRLEDEGRSVQVLVNNAGIRRDAILAMMADDDWRRVLDVNLGGAFHMSKYAVQMMSGARYGRIVNVTSPSGKFGFEGQANYAASKAGIVALTKSLSREAARRGITVNAVSPGYVDTDFIKNLPEELAREYRKSIPLRRFGTADEIAAAILFLAGKEASYITGSVLEATGGL
ncbi:MAG: 3-oxoacyl-ACP reductase FabG [Planctomycetota bacterium]|jgi:3-oxoacyl-[acyl-carrier protein] reductase|nr:3-oxoacyl-ACP reductase FabG [Planctomycetota bacterium]